MEKLWEQWCGDPPMRGSQQDPAMPSDEPKTFYAYEFEIENQDDSFRFEHLGTGAQFNMSELEARDFCAWLKAALYGTAVPPAGRGDG
jgi:hypothetical protein